MQITPPFGYREIVPFMQDQRVSRMPDNSLPEFVKHTNSLPISLSEVAEACHDFPLVFVPQRDTNLYVLVAILGMSDKENLFVTDDAWRAETYVPAYLRRYPFCMTRVTLEGVQQSQRLVCVEKDFLSPDGISMFDAPGQQTPQWARFMDFMNSYETDMEATVKFCSTMRDFKLLEPMALNANVNGQNLSLGGMFRISFDRMNTLNSSEIKTLYKNGILGTIYHHISSLSRFQRLFEMKSRRLMAAASAPSASDQAAEPVVAS
jgi:hypothetical protein